jgi:hypothetical protein
MEKSDSEDYADYDDSSSEGGFDDDSSSEGGFDEGSDSDDGTMMEEPGFTRQTSK